MISGGSVERYSKKIAYMSFYSDRLPHRAFKIRRISLINPDFELARSERNVPVAPIATKNFGGYYHGIHGQCSV